MGESRTSYPRDKTSNVEPFNQEWDPQVDRKRKTQSLATISCAAHVCSKAILQKSWSNNGYSNSWKEVESHPRSGSLACLIQWESCIAHDVQSTKESVWRKRWTVQFAKWLPKKTVNHTRNEEYRQDCDGNYDNGMGKRRVLRGYSSLVRYQSFCSK